MHRGLIGSVAIHWVDTAGEIDLNFDPTVRFTLADEGGRPVFVNPTSIVPTSGAVASRDARKSPLFNRVTIDLGRTSAADR